MERQRLDVLLRSGIHWLFLGLFFFLPLLFFRQASEVFELPKMLFVYAMTVAIVSLWLGRMIVKKQLLIHKTPLDIPILLFLLSQVASTMYSIDPRTSWFGYYGRFHGGLWSTISYTLLYYALVANFRSNTGTTSTTGSTSESSTSIQFNHFDHLAIQPFILAILASATLVSLYAILQHFGIDKNLWVQDVVNRVFSTQGQPNWLAAYIVMVMPIGWALIMSNEQAFVPSSGRGETENNDREGAKFSKTFIAHCFLLIVFFLALLFTKSRSGLIGFAIMDGIFWSLILCNYLLHGRSSKRQPTSSGTKKQYRLKTIVFNLYNFNKPVIAQFLITHLLLLVLMLVTNNPAREFLFGNLTTQIAASPSTNAQAFGSEAQARRGPRNDVVKTPALEDSIVLRKSAQGGTESGDIRRLVWSGAIELVKQRPVFGFGPETFAYSYWWVRPVEHNLTSEWNFLYNKAHNEWLNLAANTGLFGLGSHLLLLGWFTIYVLLTLKKTMSRKQKTMSADNSLLFAHCSLLIATLSALLGVEAVNFFGFSTVTIGAYTYLYMAMAVGEMRDERNEIEKRKYDHVPFTVYCLLFTVLLLVLYLLSQVSISFLADLSYARGRAYLENRYAFQALRPLEIATELVPDEPVFRSSLAEDEGLLAMSLKATGEQPDLAEKLKNESLQNFEVVEKQRPYSLSFLKTESRIVYSLGVFDPTLYERGIALSEKAAKLAPTNPSIPYTLGVMSEAMGKNGDAKRFYRASLKLKPDYVEAVEKLDERTTQ